MCHEFTTPRRMIIDLLDDTNADTRLLHEFCVLEHFDACSEPLIHEALTNTAHQRTVNEDTPNERAFHRFAGDVHFGIAIWTLSDEQ